MNITALCIGGPADGRRIVIKAGWDAYLMGGYELKEDGSVSIARYFAIRTNLTQLPYPIDLPLKVHPYRHETLTDKQAIDQLLDCYCGPGFTKEEIEAAFGHWIVDELLDRRNRKKIIAPMASPK
jgi:hypothetical protein